MSDLLIKIITALVPIGVALIGIIPSIVANRKETQKSIEQFKVDMETSIDKVSDNVNNLSNKLDRHIEDDGEMQQKQRRVRIMRFADEIRDGVQHTQDHWNEINDDLTQYQQYCDNHKYKNHKGTTTMEFIQNYYKATFGDKPQKF